MEIINENNQIILDKLLESSEQSNYINNEIELEEIKNKIENMTKLQHIEVLKILKKHKNIKLNENKNGIYINISYLPIKIIKELQLYIKYIEDQTVILEKNMV
jgi:hypothetical protein